ncbi:unnamed protein product [Discula destructiva]
MVVASNWSKDCMQFDTIDSSISPQVRAYDEAMGGGTDENPNPMGEDCLGLNVWTKASGPKGKAVLVWIYGGGFSIGTSNAPFYTGNRLAQDEDVVVVSLNYRVNIFGFPNAPEIPDQNLGLLDQRLAIEWVRDNIEGFGGDPRRITIFGESAGGRSVDLYAFAHTEDPIVNGMISQSGTVVYSPVPPVNEAPWFAVSADLGCGGADAGPATVACMRTKDAQDIMDTWERISSGVITFTSGFGPASDGKLAFADVQARSTSGNFIKRPYLVGSNDFEMGLIRALPGFGGGSVSPNASDEVLQRATEIAFGCGAARSAQDRALNGVPTWRYRYMGVWENTALAPGAGAYHSGEIPIVMGTNSLRTNSTPDTEEQAKLTTAMVHAWAEFAKDPEQGLAKLGWPQYDPMGDTLILLGDNNQSALATAPGTQYDAICNRSMTAGNATATGTGMLPTTVSGARAESPVLMRLLGAVSLAFMM